MSSPTVRRDLEQHVAEVERRREQLGADLDALTDEARAQMGMTVEKLLWKIAAGGAGAIAGALTNLGLRKGWKAARGSEPPQDPSSPTVGWGDALVWTATTAVAVAVARLVATRGAIAGWERATGTPPPGVETGRRR